MSTNSALLREIEAFTRGAGIAESTFGLQAVNDGKLVRRLRSGGRTFRETEDRIRNFMANYSPATRAKRAAKEPAHV
ncbi:MAG: hypothetical protein ABF979_16015 [Gluconobacter sp.]|uniref:hypothetical protein n=1 Tax=Gluconobacter sp. TaxID=1876758 RepID=UPI0039E8ED71